jgi:large subunit ribosomal protein L17
MAPQRKLSLPSDKRKALIRNQVTGLLWHGRIETTLARAKEIRRVAEKMVTLAVREYDKTVGASKEYHNEKGQIVKIDVVNDDASKLHARRLMMAYLYDVKEAKKEDENKADFREYGPKYRKRNGEKNCAGGYTRIYKLGPRRGDASDRVLIEMV